MAEKNKNADLGESSVEESILNITQDNLISTNENIDESVQLERPNVGETVEVECSSKSHNVDIFNQLALMMEMINNKFEQQNKNTKSIKSEINVVKVEMNNEFAKIRSELKMSDVNMNSRLESMSETIVGVKDELTIDINKIQTEMKNDIKTINEKQNEKLIETNKKFDALTNKFNDKIKKQNDKIDSNVQSVIDECEQIKQANKIQESINCLLYTSRCV